MFGKFRCSINGSKHIQNDISILYSKTVIPTFSTIPHVSNSCYSDKSMALMFLSVPVRSCSVAGGMFTVRGFFRNSLGRASANVFYMVMV